jgi:uncharacterized membrane protein
VSAAGKFALAALLAAIVAHVAFVNAAPSLIMNEAMRRIGGANAWAHAPRVTEAARAIVRPSPDLAYSACVYDLSRGPVRIAAGAWDAYMSLSLYGADSDNFFVVSDREAPDGIEVIVVRRARDAPDDAENVVVSPSGRGVALVRRLAPSPDLFAQADRARQADACAPLTR